MVDLRYCSCLWLGLVMSTSLTLAADAPKFKPQVNSDAVRFATNFSPDNQAATLLFDNLQVDSEVGKGSLPSARTKTFTYVVPIESTADVTVKQIIRGFVNEQGSGSAMLAVHDSGKGRILDLAKGIACATEKTHVRKEERREELLKAAKDAAIKDQKPSTKSADFVVELVSRVGAGKPLQSTFILSVDRLTGDDGSGALLVVDSIDLVVEPVAK